MDKKLDIEELEAELAVQLPPRRLLVALTILGLPIIGVSEVAVNADTSGPGWLIAQ